MPGTSSRTQKVRTGNFHVRKRVPVCACINGLEREPYAESLPRGRLPYPTFSQANWLARLGLHSQRCSAQYPAGTGILDGPQAASCINQQCRDNAWTSPSVNVGEIALKITSLLCIFSPAFSVSTAKHATESPKSRSNPKEGSGRNIGRNMAGLCGLSTETSQDYFLRASPDFGCATPIRACHPSFAANPESLAP